MHLFLEVRPHTEMPYCVIGDLLGQIAQLHASPLDAETAIHEFCRTQRRAAFVRIFTPRNRIWREDEIDEEGNVVSTLPLWRAQYTSHNPY